MTAINIVLQPDRAIIVSDGAFYAPDGKVWHDGAKVMPLPLLPGLLATRGVNGALALAFTEINLAFRTFDDLADNLSNWLQDFTTRHAAALSSFNGVAELDLTIAGWSHRENRPRAFVVSTRDQSGSSVEEDAVAGEYSVAPFEVFEVEEWAAMPFPSTDHLQTMGVDPGEGLLQGENHELVDQWLRFVGAQRVMKLDLGAGEHHHGVGGSILWSQVSGGGTMQSVIHKFPDTLGERIVPNASADFGPATSPGSPQPQPSAGLSRQQRRALEREQRRKASRLELVK